VASPGCFERRTLRFQPLSELAVAHKPPLFVWFEVKCTT
jgi:hypothetical protein